MQRLKLTVTVMMTRLLSISLILQFLSLCPLDSLDKQSPFITSVSNRNRELEAVKGFSVQFKLEHDGSSLCIGTFQLSMIKLPCSRRPCGSAAGEITVPTINNPIPIISDSEFWCRLGWEHTG
jgi:hypothetical protein